MDRWTMQQLKETDDITFAICILNERRRTLTPYSPLGMKLAEAAHTLHNIKEERDRYIARIAQGKIPLQDGGPEDVGTYADNAETGECVCGEVPQTPQAEPGA